MKRTAIKRKQPKRDWTAARAKVEAEDACRLGVKLGWGPACRGRLEAAHIIGRKVDLQPGDYTDPLVLNSHNGKWVHPDRIVPLCERHHRAYDAHQVDILAALTTDEQAQAVSDSGSIQSALRRTAPLVYRDTFSQAEPKAQPLNQSLSDV